MFAFNTVKALLCDLPLTASPLPHTLLSSYPVFRILERERERGETKGEREGGEREEGER